MIPSQKRLQQHSHQKHKNTNFKRHCIASVCENCVARPSHVTCSRFELARHSDTTTVSRSDRSDRPEVAAGSCSLHLPPLLRAVAVLPSCNLPSLCLPSVYQPGLWWPPRILTVSLQVTRGHDGHSSVRRPPQINTELMKRSLGVAPYGRPASHPINPSPSSLPPLKINFAHVQTLPKNQNYDNQFSMKTSAS